MYGPVFGALNFFTLYVFVTDAFFDNGFKARKQLILVLFRQNENIYILNSKLL